MHNVILSHYTIVSSTQIRPHSDFVVAVTLHDSPVPATIRLTIQNGQRYRLSKEASVQPFSTEKVIFETGPMPDPTDSGYRLIAEGIGGLVFHNESQLQLNEKHFSVLVQTDKALYQPEDVLRFRVLVVDPSTRPVDVNGNLHVQVLVIIQMTTFICVYLNCAIKFFDLGRPIESNQTMD